ncbi:MAG TPA: hypothetical protein VGN57_00935 [Pirellulaceae bacterium]|jgi:hypothetical protein|nr:hypothetical protein [Pirellulaceae bacterium]
MAVQVGRLFSLLSAARSQAPAYALSAKQAAAIATLSLLFIVQCALPLRPSGIFRDLIHAEAIVAEGGLPAADPTLPYADHARFVVLNPGGALIERAAWKLFGVSGLLVLSAALATAATGLWCAWAVRRGGDLSGAGPTLLWTVAVGWGFYDAAGTARFGFVLLPALFLLLDGAGLWSRGAGLLRSPSPSRFSARVCLAAMPVLFALWVNLDASWILGLAALWLVIAGRTTEILQDRRASRASGRASICVGLSTGLASTLATLANPYGWKLWGLLTLPLANDPFVATLGPFVTLAAWSFTGVLSAIVLAATVRALAKGSLRIRYVEALLFTGGLAFAFAAEEGRLWTLPLLGAMVLPPVWREALDRLDRYRGGRTTLPEGRDADFDEATAARQSLSQWAPSGFACLSLAGAFLLTPASDSLLGRESETLRSVVIDAPLADVPPDAFDAGLAFAPPWWSEAFAFQRLVDDPKSPARLLTDSRQATLPPSMRDDVARVLAGEEGWAAILDRYETKTLLLDALRQIELVELARAEPRWREVAATDSLVVFRREDRRR